MDGGRFWSGAPFARRVRLWRDVPGGFAPDGGVVSEPRELKFANFVLSTLERFGGYTLKTLMEEDAELLQLMNIEAMGRREES
jgi:hypothetical protein